MEFTCARIFSDHMVLQRGRPISVFGTGPDGRTVTVRLKGMEASCVCAQGRWRAVLPALEATGPQRLTVRMGDEEIAFEDVALGEVWLAGGQSNMEYALEDARSWGQDIKEAEDADLRYYHVVKTATEQDRARAEKAVPPGWVKCTPETAGRFSAVAYHFAKRLRAHLNVPVGIVGCNWGGTSASCWLSREALKSDADLKVYLEDYDREVSGRTEAEYERQKAEFAAAQEEHDARLSRVTVPKTDFAAYREAIKDIAGPWPPPQGKDCFLRPCGLYETMLRHVTPYTLRGVIWYQGEADEVHPRLYARLLTAMIEQWRRDFMEPDLFFALVQLTAFAGENADGDAWGTLRLQQALVRDTVPHAAMAVIYDVGEYDNIHPTDKKTVGERLGDQALDNAYGADTGARLFRCVEKRASGGEVTLTFDGRICVRGEEARGFALCGADGKYHRARACVDGDTVRLVSEGVAQPRGARYAMTNWTQGNAMQENGIPLPPFEETW